MRDDGYERDEGAARPFYGFGTVNAETPPRDPDDDRTQDHPRFFDEPPRAAASPYPPPPGNPTPPPGYRVSPPPAYGPNGVPPAYGDNAAPSPYAGNGAPPAYGPPVYGRPSYGPEQPTYGQHTYGQPTFGRPPEPAERPYGEMDSGDERDTAMIPAVGGRHAAPPAARPDSPRSDRPGTVGDGRHSAPTTPPGYGVPGGGLPERWSIPAPAVAERPEQRERNYDDEPVRSRRAPGRRRDRTAADEEDEDARRVMPLWQELPLLLVVAFCLAVLIRTFLLQAFYIPSTSMEATLLVGDRVLVNKIVYDVRQPNRGEVVVFRGPPNWAPDHTVPPANNLFSRIGRTLGDLVGVSRPGEKDFIKRVIGLPGDRVSCCDPDGRVYVNGKGIDEAYINVNSSLDTPPSPGTCGPRRFAEVLVPPGQVFVMGDNRIVSQDSRCQGPVPIENIIGRAFVIVWPNSRWDTVGVPSTFDNVPPPVAVGPAGRVPNGPTLAVTALTLPIVSALVIAASSTRKRRWVRRTLLQ